jgi:hypothetical protein
MNFMKERIKKGDSSFVIYLVFDTFIGNYYKYPTGNHHYYIHVGIKHEKTGVTCSLEPPLYFLGIKKLTEMIRI